MNLTEKKEPYYWKSISTNFPGSPHTTGFVGYFREPISQTFPVRWFWLSFARLWEINEKTHAFPMWWSIAWKGKKYEHQFPRFSPYDEFCYIFPYYEKFMGKPMHFPFDEVYHRMRIEWEKSTHNIGKGWVPVSQTFLTPWVLLHFPVMWEIYGETHAFPICWSIP